MKVSKGLYSSLLDKFMPCGCGFRDCKSQCSVTNKIFWRNSSPKQPHRRGFSFMMACWWCREWRASNDCTVIAHESSIAAPISRIHLLPPTQFLREVTVHHEVLFCCSLRHADWVRVGICSSVDLYAKPAFCYPRVVNAFHECRRKNLHYGE